MFYKALEHQDITVFTVNRSFLRDNLVCRDYQFSQNHNKSYLTPTASSGDNPAYAHALAPTPDLDTNIDVNADADIDANGFFDSLELDLYNANDIDSSHLTSQSEDPTVDPFDLISQTLPLTQTRPPALSQSWVYEHFFIVVLDGRQYTPKGTSKLQTDKRRCCRHCSYKVLDSKRYKTSRLSVHLLKHSITKACVP